LRRGHSDVVLQSLRSQIGAILLCIQSVHMPDMHPLITCIGAGPGTLASQKLSIFKSEEAHDDMLSRLKNSDVEEAGVSTVFRGLHDDLNASRQPLKSTNKRLRHQLLLLPPKQLQDICQHRQVKLYT
jgi:hypothetical protein